MIPNRETGGGSRRQQRSVIGAPSAGAWNVFADRCRTDACDAERGTGCGVDFCIGQLGRNGRSVPGRPARRCRYRQSRHRLSNSRRQCRLPTTSSPVASGGDVEPNGLSPAGGTAGSAQAEQACNVSCRPSTMAASRYRRWVRRCELNSSTKLDIALQATPQLNIDVACVLQRRQLCSRPSRCRGRKRQGCLA